MTMTRHIEFERLHNFRDLGGRIPEAERFTYANLSIEHRPYDQAEIDPDLDPWRFLADRFAEVAEDGVEEIRAAIELISEGPGPAVFHCTSGKDRTGLIAALVLTLADLTTRHGSVEAYLTARVGITPATKAALRARLLT
ncbi:tyrosine-protein phosphatase [Streptomyces sp. NPDC059443]|uniref:tyrosine-protein phosphatase n=1 Tax=unclassified Streptomyces TaxID=2593676 RepID=UPI0036CB5EB3